MKIFLWQRKGWRRANRLGEGTCTRRRLFERSYCKEQRALRVVQAEQKLAIATIASIHVVDDL